MKRFHFAIRAIESDILKHIGKVATKAVSNGHDPMYALRVEKVKRMKEAIGILENHERNNHC
jgi:hypothetical protein